MSQEVAAGFWNFFSLKNGLIFGLGVFEGEYSGWISLYYSESSDV